jgi:hypothetical protein
MISIDRSLKAIIKLRLCYTELVYDRINRKLGIHLSPEEIEDFVAGIIEHTDETHFLQKGKNYYIVNDTEHIRITINSYTYRVITADKI